MLPREPDGLTGTFEDLTSLFISQDGFFTAWRSSRCSPAAHGTKHARPIKRGVTRGTGGVCAGALRLPSASGFSARTLVNRHRVDFFGLIFYRYWRNDSGVKCFRHHLDVRNANRVSPSHKLRMKDVREKSRHPPQAAAPDAKNSYSHRPRKSGARVSPEDSLQLSGSFSG